MVGTVEDEIVISLDKVQGFFRGEMELVRPVEDLGIDTPIVSQL